METSIPAYRWAVAIYDRLYRFLHQLDHPAAKVGPVLRIEVTHSRETVRLQDGTVVRPGDRICVIHLNNDHVRELHVDCESPIRVGLEFRRQLVTSLRELAKMAETGGRLLDVRALVATTIFHQGLKRLGFETASDRLCCPELVAFYQRALLASLHPAGRLRLRRATYQRAQRLWLSRTQLLGLYDGRRPGGAETARALTTTVGAGDLRVRRAASSAD